MKTDSVLIGLVFRTMKGWWACHLHQWKWQCPIKTLSINSISTISQSKQNLWLRFSIGYQINSFTRILHHYLPFNFYSRDQKVLGFGYHHTSTHFFIQLMGDSAVISSRFNLIWEISRNLEEEYYRCSEIHGHNEFIAKMNIPIDGQLYIRISTHDRNGSVSMSNVICSCMIRISWRLCKFHYSLTSSTNWTITQTSTSCKSVPRSYKYATIVSFFLWCSQLAWLDQSQINENAYFALWYCHEYYKFNFESPTAWNVRI